MSSYQKQLDSLSSNLAILNHKIQIENSNNKLDLNILLEATTIKLFNLIHEKKLINANSIGTNFPGIDAIDEESSIMVQITSTDTLVKIKKTIKQIIDKKLFAKYDQLYFIFLKTKGNSKYTKGTKLDLISQVDGKFNFNLDKNIIYLDDFYKHFIQNHDLNNLKKCNNLVSEVLGSYLFQNKGNLKKVSLTFHEESNLQVLPLIIEIITNGFIVYINSEKAFERLINEKPIYSDYIVLTNEKKELETVKHTIIVLSNEFIQENFEETRGVQCNILKSAIENENKSFSTTFDPLLKGVSLIRNTVFNCYCSISSRNLANRTQEILNSLFSEAFFTPYSNLEIKEALVDSFPSFKYKEIGHFEDFYLLTFFMPEHKDICINYLILQKDFNLQRAGAEYRNNFDLIHLTVLVPKNFNHTTRKRLDNVAIEFKIKNVKYIDEHLFDKNLGNIKQSPILEIEEFIRPIVRINGDDRQINDIIQWIVNDNENSIAIIKAAGGIGKTTVCEKIHDILINEFNRYIVIFIDSSKYIEQFSKVGTYESGVYELYDIFERCHPQGSQLSRNSFYLNLSLGNIIIIFDGVDEIISTISHFDLNQFLLNLEGLRSRIGKGKILVNCRDTYIDELKNIYKGTGHMEDKLVIYELLGFNYILAESYFRKFFTQVDDVGNCLKLLVDFYPENSKESYHYHPFILEVIVSLVSNYSDFSLTEGYFGSRILNQFDSNDFLIYKIFHREIIKKEKNGFQLTIDQQVRFFSLMAIEEKGFISRKEEFHDILRKIGIVDRLIEITSGLIDHPILRVSNDNYSFRYVHFNSYFKLLAIYNKLLTPDNFIITDRMIKVIAEEANFNSVISKGILKRIREERDKRLLLKSTRSFIQNMIEYTSSDSSVKLKKQKCLSNLFYILLKSSEEFKIGSNELIRIFFQVEENVIKHLCLIDIPSYSKLVLDFSEFYFINCVIKNYQDFFYCNFTENTYFDETCSISEVYSSSINIDLITLESKNFDSKISGDNSVFKAVKVKEVEGYNINTYLKDFFKSFHQNNRFKNNVNIDELPLFNDKVITSLLIIDILKRNEILISSIPDCFSIKREYQSKLNRYLKQGLSFKELNLSIKDLQHRLVISTEGGSVS